MSAHGPGSHRTPSMTDEQKLAKLKDFIRLAKEGYPQGVVVRRVGVDPRRVREWCDRFYYNWPYPTRKSRQ